VTPASLFHLKIVLRIAALLTVLGALVMVFVVLAVGQTEQQGYLQSLSRLQISQERLMPLVLAAGLFLLTVSAFVTWLIALYSSFRIAGPLYRLTRNLEQELQQNRLERPMPIRRGDQFQTHGRLLREAVAALHDHYQDLGRQLMAMENDLAGGTMAPDEVLRQYREQLHRLHGDVRY
jgi:nitrate/nitrite-specific signal transduction histidine kinase